MPIPYTRYYILRTTTVATTTEREQKKRKKKKKKKKMQAEVRVGKESRTSTTKPDARKVKVLSAGADQPGREHFREGKKNTAR